MIEDWQWWVATGVITLLGFFMGVARDHRKERLTSDSQVDEKFADYDKRMAVMESTLLTQEGARVLMQDITRPLIKQQESLEKHMVELSKVMVSVQIELAKRGGDTNV